MAQSMQMMNPAVTVPAMASSNTAMSRSFRLVCNLSIATLVFSIILFINGILSIFIPEVLIFSAASMAVFNVFWVTVPMFITSILGIVGYYRGFYRHCQATAHLVFAIITALATIGGLVFLGLTLANLNINVISVLPNNTGLQLTQPGLIIAYVGASFAVVIYLFFLYACIHGSVIYFKAPKNLAVFSNYSVTAVPLVDEVPYAAGYPQINRSI